jgi:3-hydroxymyristoyl/3-hydroxydecanoyl-(acyl carrier protein) dehydratase
MSFVLSSDHPSLPGHFPGRPIVPGVVLLDRVLDAIEQRHGPLGPLRLPQVKFVEPLLPDQTAQVELESVAPQQARSRWRFRVLRGDTLLASGEIVQP